jgi:GNAT superfamily N-acetyltransferase
MKNSRVLRNSTKLKFETARTPKKIAKFAKIILDCNLHIGGLMSCWASPHHLENVKAITIVTNKNIPIAAGIRYCFPNAWKYALNTGIFVKKGFRRRGIGSNILNRLQLPNITFVVGQGCYASIPFYTKNKDKFKENIVLTWEAQGIYC